VVAAAAAPPPLQPAAPPSPLPLPQPDFKSEYIQLENKLNLGVPTRICLLSSFSLPLFPLPHATLRLQQILKKINKH